MAPAATLNLALPKGRMQPAVLGLLAEAGIDVSLPSRGYRPHVSVPWLACKLLKPQSIVEMVHVGSRDAGFAGADWVAELRAHDVVEVLDTGLDAVGIVGAAPRGLLVDGKLPNRPLRVASEFERLTRDWIAKRGIAGRFVRSYGATEVLPPEDADCIVDVSASGATLEANGLVVIDEVMRSSTRLYASREALSDPRRAETIANLVLLLGSVLEARRRVMLEVNVPAERLEAVVHTLPCMRRATISPLHGSSGYAVKAAVPRTELPALIPRVKARGGTDLVISPIAQVVP